MPTSPTLLLSLLWPQCKSPSALSLPDTLPSADTYWQLCPGSRPSQVYSHEWWHVQCWNSLQAWKGSSWVGFCLVPCTRLGYVVSVMGSDASLTGLH